VNARTATDAKYPSVAAMLRERRPVAPVYCIHPDIYTTAAREFVAGFPGRVLYAVKANDHPAIIRLLFDAGVRHFDCASLPEIARVRSACADATAYFMVPVRLRGAAREAQDKYGVRHFMVDHPSGIEPLAREIDMSRAVVFARMAAHHQSAMQDLSSRFGAPPAEVPGLLQQIAEQGAEPALAFNVGSAVTDPEAYSSAMELAARVLLKLPFRVRLLDIGGGFPKSYPGFPVPPLENYFERIAALRASLPLAPGGELMGEPGRALAAPGLSAVVEVLLRKGDRLYLNDGMYGIFWELRFPGHDRYPVKAYRDGAEIHGALQSYKLYGPTCDGSDVLPGQVDLPVDIRPGDYLEFGSIGAYSLSGRTNFNGHYSDTVVTITGA
jgi:ornithine decarboxylase